MREDQHATIGIADLKLAHHVGLVFWRADDGGAVGLVFGVERVHFFGSAGGAFSSPGKVMPSHGDRKSKLRKAWVSFTGS